MHNIRYTKLAEDDLSSLFQLIYADKPNSAVDFIDKLDTFITLLEENPYMGIACKEKNISQDCRVLIYEEYLIFYTVKEDEVVIIRILNSHHDYENTL